MQSKNAHTFAFTHNCATQYMCIYFDWTKTRGEKSKITKHLIHIHTLFLWYVSYVEIFNTKIIRNWRFCVRINHQSNQRFVDTIYICSMNVQSVSGIGATEFKWRNSIRMHWRSLLLNTKSNVNLQLDLFFIMRNSLKWLDNNNVYETKENVFMPLEFRWNIWYKKGSVTAMTELTSCQWQNDSW